MKHKRIFIAAVTSTIVLWSLSSAAKTVVEMKDAQGKSVGTVTIVESGTGEKGAGVGLDLNLHDLPPGRHGIHFHQNAKCDGPDFKSAGPHFNGASGHGDHMGMPAGDIPDFSLIVAADGTGHATVVAPNITLGTDDHSVFSNGGTAIVIHAVAGGTSSAAPPRIACGVISKPE